MQLHNIQLCPIFLKYTNIFLKINNFLEWLKDFLYQNRQLVNNYQPIFWLKYRQLSGSIFGKAVVFPGDFILCQRNELWCCIILKISPGLIFGQSTFFWAYFRGGLFSRGLIFGMKFALKRGAVYYRGVYFCNNNQNKKDYFIIIMLVLSPNLAKLW